jgi:hypothetical protein
MDMLVTMIVLWLSTNFDLVATNQHPTVKIVPPTEIVYLRYGARTPEKQREVLALSRNAGSAEKGREAVAVYDDAARTIMLPEGWSGSTPAELSVLVHEIVHHLQKVEGLKYECPAAREALAYAAQERWLSLFGRSLLSEFDIDPFTLKVSTSCGF